MKILISQAIIFSVIELMFLFIAFSNKKAEQESEGKSHVVIKLPKVYAVLGVVCFVIMLGIYIAFFLTSKDEGLVTMILCHVFFALMTAVCLIITIVPKVWRIDCFGDEDYVIYRTVFGRKHKIYYKDIIKLTKSDNMITVKTKKKTFYIDPHADNINRFIDRINT